VTITDNAIPATQTVSLTGNGGSNTTSKVSPTSLTFPGQTVGSASGAQAVTITNTGSGILSIAGITASGDSSQSNNCGESVAINASCTVSVTFDPTAGGTRTGTVIVSDSAADSPQTVSVTGTGEDFMLTAPSVSSSATVTPGGTATYSLNVLAMGGYNQNTTFACVGAPAGAQCEVSPASTVISGPTSVTLTVVTTAPSLGHPWRNPLLPLPPARVPH
jgi:hypothetical protein